MSTRQARYRERQMAANPDGWRERNRRSQAAFRSNHPEKKAAWNAVYSAIRRGILARPDACQSCGQSCKPEASHDNYARPLDVEWLCKPCHTAKDFQLRKAV